ncbi:hypothetical protein ACILPN_05030 [Yersinia wautersii]|uniref:Uncharacterized protein n=1 Tax=Yersinia pseudotuberculosis TaxID=633 RepID=A0A380Q2S3_YERPU|nr:hypothetical protein [Yersinia pseudotuberculosis]SUP80051.1 Uncharacterised protein [Yersinia pseudotuberculosis]
MVHLVGKLCGFLGASAWKGEFFSFLTAHPMSEKRVSGDHSNATYRLLMQSFLLFFVKISKKSVRIHLI